MADNMECEMREINEIRKRHEVADAHQKMLYATVPAAPNMGTPAHHDRAILLDHIATLEAQLKEIEALTDDYYDGVLTIGERSDVQAILAKYNK